MSLIRNATILVTIAALAAGCSTPDKHKKDHKAAAPVTAKAPVQPQPVMIAPGTGTTAPPFPDAPVMPSFSKD
ncbi:hypothetical protein [Acetobacter thailandicus]|uniref:hypothetical protein n=1 Tax=Acetobacter thailandicus TaxID=1502842 RepID=UPI001BA7512A|nr:hypothetical protein [Acetobacter thailandicus]MBS0959657.1 hypothetical protein [Acetobacter thailandicus]